MAMLTVDGVVIKTPSVFVGTAGVSDPASGRTLDALMHKNRIAQKRKLSLSWNHPTPEEAAAVLQAFNPEYVRVRYPGCLEREK